MKQTKLVIASVLKPVNDIRMFEKFAISISQAKKYDINIIGFSTKNIPTAENMSFYPIFDFNRLSIKRLLTSIIYLKELIEIKPKIIIITTHELLLPTIIYKLFRSATLYYDVRENYYLNIKHTNSFPIIIKDLLALWVRLKEIITRSFIKHYFLAEKQYLKELHFTKNKYTIIENKAKPTSLKKKIPSTINMTSVHLLFSGTLANTTGLFDVIELHQKMVNINKEIYLKIIGYCPDKYTYEKLINRLKNCKNIKLVGGDKLVDHDEIERAIIDADLGLIYYPPNVANDHSIPTKLYEYLAAQLPIITEPKNQFKELLSPYNAAVYFSFQSNDIEQLLNEISSTLFYTNQPKSEIFWEGEELKLLDIIRS